jgi:hypothetical protein
MLIKKANDIRSSGVTAKDIYLNRRQFILAASATALSAGAILSGRDASLTTRLVIAGERLADLRKSSAAATSWIPVE